MFEVTFCFHGAIFIRVFFLWYKGIVRDERFVADTLKTEEKKVLAFSLGTFRLWFCRSRCFWKSSKVNKFGTFLKVKYLILLNIISVFPTYVGMFLSHCTAQDHVFPTHVGMFLSFPRARACESGSLPHACGVFQKSKNFYFCLHIESALYISAFNEPILVGSLLNRLCVCLCRPSSSVLGRVWELWVARHISALFVNLTFHLRRNHHVRRICSRP